MQETYLCKTDLGEIEIPRTIIAHAVLRAVEQMDGQVLVTNKKGKLLAAIGKRGNADETDCLEIESSDEALLVRVHLEIGAAPATVIIHVTGTLSKKMAPRDIEYRIDYED